MPSDVKRLAADLASAPQASALVGISADHIQAMDRLQRVNFVNSLSGFKSANLVGTVSETGATNLAIVSSVVHLGADPPLMGMVTRPRSVERHTVENILATGVFTLNHVHTGIVKASHQTAARYPREQSEFEQVGLTPYYSLGHAAPYVAESRLSIGLKLRECKHLDINDTDFLIGEVVQVLVLPEAVTADGFIDLQALGTVAVSGLDSYHRTERLGRLRYPKPDSAPEWMASPLAG